MPVSINRVSPKRSKEITWGWSTVSGIGCVVGLLDGAICWLDLQPGTSAQARLTGHWGSELLRRDDARVEQALADAWVLLARGLRVPVHMRGTDFQLSVWRTMVHIPAGQTLSYGDLAAQIGRPHAARAVGAAAAANTIALLIPCHRVCPATGGAGAYRWRHTLKRQLLAAESSVGRNRGADSARFAGAVTVTGFCGAKSASNQAK